MARVKICYLVGASSSLDTFKDSEWKGSRDCSLQILKQSPHLRGLGSGVRSLRWTVWIRKGKQLSPVNKPFYLSTSIPSSLLGTPLPMSDDYLVR